MAQLVFQRDISERADLFSMVCMLSHAIASHLLEKEPIDVAIQNAAREILSQFQFPKKELLMQQILEKNYWKSRELSQLSQRENSEDKESYLISVSKSIELAILPLFDFKIVLLTKVLLPSHIQPDLPIEDFSCFEFALAYLGIQGVFSEWDYKDLLGLLGDWGFEEISLEQLKLGDLVVFLKDGIPQHMGVQCETGILSKPGDKQRFAWVHSLEEASRRYGNQVRFFRKNPDNKIN